MSPIDTCPAEVVSIFLYLSCSSYSKIPKHATDVEMDVLPPWLDDMKHRSNVYKDDAHDQRTHLMQVCTLWSEIIKANPLFWRKIVLSSSNTTSDLVRQWIGRAGSMPLTIILNLPWNRCSQRGKNDTQPFIHRSIYKEIENIREFLYAIRDRVSTLDVYAGCSIQMAVVIPETVCILSSPTIHTIGLHYKRLCRDSLHRLKQPLLLPSPVPIPNGKPPTLRSLMLTSVGFEMDNNSHNQFAHLTSLDLRLSKGNADTASMWISIQGILRRTSRLIVLCLVVPGCPLIPPSTPPIYLESLNSTTISTTNSHHISDLLNLFIMPKISSLSVTFYGQQSRGPITSSALGTLLNFWNSPTRSHSVFRTLQTLIITWAPTADAEIRHILDELKELVVLGLFNLRDRTSGTFRFLESLTNTSLINELALKNGGIVEIQCPRLTALKIHGSDNDLESTLSRSRRNMGYPLKLEFLDGTQARLLLPW